MTCKSGHIPPMIVCPMCQPGTISYAGRVISHICKGCKELLMEDK